MPTSNFSLFKKNGYYYIQFVDDGKRKQRSTHTTNKAEALKTLGDFKQLVRDQPKRKLISDFASEFAEYAKGNYAIGTIEIYQSTFKLFQGRFGDISLTEITPQHWDIYKVHRLQKVSAHTVNIELRSMKAALNTALRWRILDENPFARLRLAQVPDIAPVFFTREQVEKLLSVITETWLREIVLFAVVTGMRRGEITNLQWKDLDMKNKLITVQSSATFRTKSGRRRIVPMNDIAFIILSKCYDRAASGYVFTLNNGKILDSWVADKFKRYVKALNMDPRLHFHSLRHSFASWLAYMGVSIYQISKLLGHVDVKVTQAYYAHLQPEQMHETVNKIHLQLN
ncbi:MAG TPA: tyrosine-type recombinase/integrase [Bacteroidota bacterium]|nr:tyrosine-type recombinase/integrase [Bacteroidota bacterium]